MTMDINKKRNISLIILLLILYVPRLYFFGYRIIISLLLLSITALVYQKILHLINKDIKKSYSLFTILLLPLILPQELPFYMLILSLLFGFIIGNSFFGGNDYGIVSSTALAWGFATLSFKDTIIETSLLTINNSSYTHATSISLITISIIGLILLVLRYSDFLSYISFLSIFFILSILLYYSETTVDLKNIVNENILIAGFILIPQRKYSAKTTIGSLITGLISGTAAFIIRYHSSYQDGVIFSVLIYNIFSPLVDELIIKLSVQNGVSDV